ncbi:MAG: hypothetical protein JST26_15085 [Bacteroidetes bacterium]|nr:hypothetical protein [Bacteroidota bacterium]
MAGLFIGCADKEVNHEKTELSAENNLVEISPFIMSTVSIMDSTGPLTVNYDHSQPVETNTKYRDFYRAISSEQMKTLLRGIMHSGNSMVYSNLNGDKFTHEQIMSLHKICDSIATPGNNSRQEKIYVCDSTAMYDIIRKITFYESWHLNSKTGMLEKKCLGYGLYAVTEYFNGQSGKSFLKPVAYIFPDDASYNKVKESLLVTTTAVEKHL